MAAERRRLNRLSPNTLNRLPGEIAVPAYDRSAIRTGVVHLGIGAFHRAHQADVFDQALASGDPRWGILGASLRSPGVRDQLEPQGGLYALSVRDGTDERIRIVGAVTGVCVAPEDPAALVARVAHPDVHLVTLTVTEKGYKLDPITGTLLTSDPDVLADLDVPHSLRTPPALLAAGLRLRRERGLGALTVISCDNVPHNGTRLRDATLAFARHHDPGTADWIASRCAFPQTMVDRIVPATTDEDLETMSARLGVRDEGMVKTEPFMQWVIEDRFAGERPDFEAFGVQVTPSVVPWEEAKLRLLNGAHSAIAYLGGLAGYEFVHAAMASATYRQFVSALWDESAATLSPPKGLDIPVYRSALLERFANTSLRHRTHQIATDGSQKLPQRLIAPAAFRVDRGLPIPRLALAIAAWMVWQRGREDTGRPFWVDDPMATTTRKLLDAAGPAPADQARSLLSLNAVFPPRLATNPAFAGPVANAYCLLVERGTEHAVFASKRLAP